MAQTTYPSELTLRDARALYFKDNGFGDDGGYNDPWVTFKLGPLPLTIPNTAGRKRAVPFHDLHHIVTGFSTDFLGEFEISAWEIGAGCTQYPAAWIINLSGLAGGALFASQRAFAAFCLGRRTRTLYGRDLTNLLQSSVGDARALCGLAPLPNVEPSRSDRAQFVLMSTLGAMTGLSMFAAGLVASPAVLALTALRTRHAAGQSAG